MRLVNTQTGEVQEAFGPDANNMLAGGVWVAETQQGDPLLDVPEIQEAAPTEDVTSEGGT